MSFFEINSSWDSDADGDYFATGDEFQDSHPLTYFEDENDSDDERHLTFDEIIEIRRERSEQKGNESAPNHGKNFGLREVPKKREREGRMDIKPGDIFFDRKDKQFVLVTKNDSREGKKYIDILFAKGIDTIRNPQLMWAEPFRIRDNADYVESFKRPLTLETLLFFVYEYSDKNTWSIDKKNEFKKVLDSNDVRDNFKDFLDEYVDTSPDPQDAVRSVFPRKPGNVYSMIGRFEKQF